jgi:hypothetical protein
LVILALGRPWRPGNARAPRQFGRYWLLIRPFSGRIRRQWLAAITRRAARA